MNYVNLRVAGAIIAAMRIRDGEGLTCAARHGGTTQGSRTGVPARKGPRIARSLFKFWLWVAGPGRPGAGARPLRGTDDAADPDFLREQVNKLFVPRLAVNKKSILP